ncbi:MAG: hypothetical protein WC503_02935 [Candidatus Shapirobacteria bacterium]
MKFKEFLSEKKKFMSKKEFEAFAKETIDGWTQGRGLDASNLEDTVKKIAEVYGINAIDLYKIVQTLKMSKVLGGKF